MADWIYNGKVITNPFCFAVGFIYRISFDDGTWYIGKKNFKIKRTRPPLKGKKRKRVDYVESNWKKYCSSSDKVKEKVLNGMIPHREILYICCSKTELTYQENKHLYAMSCLEEPLCLNDNIHGKIYRTY